MNLLKLIALSTAATFLLLNIKCNNKDNEDKEYLESAKGLFQKGDYKQSHKICQQVINGKPKQEILSEANILLTESSVGIEYSLAESLSQKDKIAALNAYLGMKKNIPIQHILRTNLIL